MNPTSSIIDDNQKDTRYIQQTRKHPYHYGHERDHERFERERSRDHFYKSYRPYEQDDYVTNANNSSYYERGYDDKKKLYSYILLPKNYYGYIAKNIQNLKKDLRKEIKDDFDIKYDYTLPPFKENIFKLETYSVGSKATAIKIISEYLFQEMKKLYPKMSFLKVSILIPDNVIGFIIGIEGKNINTIRDNTGTKIEVHKPNDSKKYRQIEISGSPYNISKAAEQIYVITNKYINFGKPQRHSDAIRNEGNHKRRYSKSPSYSRSPPSDYGRRDGMIRNDNSEERRKYSREREKVRNIDGYSNMKNDREMYGYRVHDKIIRGRDRERDRDRHDRDRDKDQREKDRDVDYRNRNNDYKERDREGRMNDREGGSNASGGAANYQQQYTKGRREQSGDNNSNNNNNNGNSNNNNNVSYSKGNNNNNNDNENNNINNNNNTNDNNNNNNNYTSNTNTTQISNANNQTNSTDKQEQKGSPNDSNINQIEPGESKQQPKEYSSQHHVSSHSHSPYDNKQENESNNSQASPNHSNNFASIIKSKAQTDINLTDLENCDLDIILSLDSINNISKYYKNNLWIELETNYKCQISKRTEKLGDREVQIITFTGTPEQNSLALFNLQNILLNYQDKNTLSK